MKKILIFWIILALLLITVLTVVGLNVSKKNKPYKELEETIKFKTESLIGQSPSFLEELHYKVTIEDLKNNGYEVNTNINNDKCEGYVIIDEKMQVLKYKPYIKCEKYTTKGYIN